MRKLATVLVAILWCVGFASVARANTYQLSGPLVQRQGNTGTDVGYRGPRFEVTRWGSSSDTYVCPAGTFVSNWVVVAALRDSVGRSYAPWTYGASGDKPVNQITIHVTNWSLAATVDLHAVVSCTNAAAEFPFPPHKIPGCHTRPGRNCLPPMPPGDFEAFWDSQFAAHTPGTAEYAELVKRAFCWSLTFPGCSSHRQVSDTQQFALHDGTNAIATAVRDASLMLPPAVRLTEPAGCTARRETLTSENRSGHLSLVLRCHGLKRGSTARIRIAKPVRLSFRLHNGRGSVEVRLAKPPGVANPLVYLAYGQANKSCGNVHTEVRDRSRNFDLRVTARCGRSAGNALAHLSIGGLIG